MCVLVTPHGTGYLLFSRHGGSLRSMASSVASERAQEICAGHLLSQTRLLVVAIVGRNGVTCLYLTSQSRSLGDDLSCRSRCLGSPDEAHVFAGGGLRAGSGSTRTGLWRARLESAFARSPEVAPIACLSGSREKAGACEAGWSCELHQHPNGTHRLHEPHTTTQYG